MFSIFVIKGMFAKAIFSLEHYEPKKLGPTEPTALRFTPLRDQFEDAQYMPNICPLHAQYMPNTFPIYATCPPTPLAAAFARLKLV